MTDLDTLLREALELQAERAPQPEQVRARLDTLLQPHRTMTRRRSRLRPVALATFATAGVITGVTLAAVAGLPHLNEGSPAATPGSAPTSTPSGSRPTGAATSADGTFTIPLGFSPTALPAGWHEVSRSLSDNHLARRWRAGQANLDGSDAGPRLDFELLTSTQASVFSPTNPRAAAVTVAGRQGQLLDGGDKLVIDWDVAPGTHAEILTIGLTRTQLLTAAESVRPDTRSATFPLDAGLQGATRGHEVTLDGPDRWMLRDSVDGVVVTVGTTASLQAPGAGQAGTKRLTVQGHPARFRPVGPDHPDAELVVTLGSGRFLTVSILDGGGQTSATASDPAAGPSALAQPPGPTLPADEATAIALADKVRWKVPSFA